MVRVTYTGPFDAVDIPGGLSCRRGESIDVPDELAHGTPPTDDHPGTSGLLAQTAWRVAAPAAPAADETPAGTAKPAGKTPKE